MLYYTYVIYAMLYYVMLCTFIILYYIYYILFVEIVP